MARKRVNQKQANAALVSTMKKWQKVEQKSIESIKKTMKELKNPLIKRVFKIIQNDSSQHYKVQQFIIDSLEKKAISLTPEELGAIWTVVEKHIEMERETIALGQEAKDVSNNFIHKYLINYLITDERKHDDLLDQLENLKNKIYPYA